jgi:hypothetical protein
MIKPPECKDQPLEYALKYMQQRSHFEPVQVLEKQMNLFSMIVGAELTNLVTP